LGWSLLFPIPYVPCHTYFMNKRSSQRQHKPREREREGGGRRSRQRGREGYTSRNSGACGRQENEAGRSESSEFSILCTGYVACVPRCSRTPPWPSDLEIHFILTRAAKSTGPRKDRLSLKLPNAFDRITTLNENISASLINQDYCEISSDVIGSKSGDRSETRLIDTWISLRWTYKTEINRNRNRFWQIFLTFFLPLYNNTVFHLWYVEINVPLLEDIFSSF